MVKARLNRQKSHRETYTLIKRKQANKQQQKERKKNSQNPRTNGKNKP